MACGSEVGPVRSGRVGSAGESARKALGRRHLLPGLLHVTAVVFFLLFPCVPLSFCAGFREVRGFGGAKGLSVLFHALSLSVYSTGFFGHDHQMARFIVAHRVWLENMLSLSLSSPRCDVI